MTDELATSHAQGRPVAGSPDLKYIYLRRRSRGAAHLAVYAVGVQDVTVLHVFHSAQDGQRAVAP